MNADALNRNQFNLNQQPTNTMCMVSNIGDGWKDQFPHKWPQFPFQPPYVPPQISREDFEALKREVEELKKLLEAAKAFDKATGQHHCEMDEKVKLIKEIAKIVGVDLGDVFEEERKKK